MKKKLMYIGLVIIMVFIALPTFALARRTLDENDKVLLSGNVHRNARSEHDVGAANADLAMERMILTLRLTAEKQASLERFLAEQQKPTSGNYQHWLTPQEFGERFGPTAADIADATLWLQSKGFTVEEVAKSGVWINFSGTVGKVERAFNTGIRNYKVNGRLYHANAENPSIPRGLADLVGGVVTLHNFPRKTMINGIKALKQNSSQPNYTNGSTHYMSPGDFATIYNVKALYDVGITGAGQSIAIVGRTHPSSANWATFRSLMGLPANAPQVIVNGADPGDLGEDENVEADLDVEWAGAVAKGATIKFVTSKSTSTTDGVDLSAQYIVNNNLAPTMSTSFGLCEAQMSPAENLFYKNLWAQATAQGITPFVASGDSGAAGCDVGSDTTGTGKGVNGLASTPYNVAVGGTQLDDGAGGYWGTTNTNYASALGYIPEIAWNESGSVSGGDGLWATSGGASSIYSKPSWQVSLGVPEDGKRYIPDVSLAAASNTGYIVQSQGALYIVGGTSASSPAFAGIMALIVQKTGQRQGNANVRLYQLGAAQYGASGTAVYHDITSGNNTVPGVTGYSCATGYDLATGLGTVDAAAIVANWATTTASDFAISVTPTSISAIQGASATTTVTTTVSGNFSNAVSLSVSGLPVGTTASFSSASISAPGSGNATLTLTTTTSTPAGSYTITVSGADQTKTHAATLTLVVTAANNTATLFSDGFESTGWYAVQISGRAVWSLASSGRYPKAMPNGGSRLADFNSYTSPKGSQTRIYRASGFAVPASASKVTLNFWMYHDKGYAANNDKLQFQASTNRATWTNVGSAVSRYNGTTGWSKVSIDLTAYKGKTLFIGFMGISAYGNDIYLDDVSVVTQ